MYKLLPIVLFFLNFHSEMYSQTETIRSFVTPSFEASVPANAIFETGVRLYPDGIYSGDIYFQAAANITKNISANVDMSLRTEESYLAKRYGLLITARYNILDNFCLGPFANPGTERYGLFGAYKNSLFGFSYEAKLAYDFTEGNYAFISASLKNKFSNKLEGLLELILNDGTIISEKDFSFLLSAGVEYKLGNYFHLRGSFGMIPDQPYDESIFQVGVSYNVNK